MGDDRPPDDDGLEYDARVSAAGGSGLSEEPESPTLDRVVHPATPAVIALYDAWGKPDEAARYRAMLATPRVPS